MVVIRELTHQYTDLRSKARSRFHSPTFHDSTEIELDTYDSNQHEHRITVPPGWMANVYDVEHDIQVIREKMASLSDQHKKHLLPGFSDNVEEQQEIEITTREITKMFQNSHTKIKRIGSTNKDTTKEDKAIKKNIQSKLANSLQQLSLQFRRNQQDFLQKSRGLESIEGDDEFDLNRGQLMQQVQDTGFTDDQMGILVRNENDSAQWEREMKNILNSMQELHSIFKDLSMLITEQGTIVDRIDYNLEVAEHNIDDSIVNIIHIKKSVSRSRTKYCMLLLCVLVLITLVLVALKVALKYVVLGALA